MAKKKATKTPKPKVKKPRRVPWGKAAKLNKAINGFELPSWGCHVSPGQIMSFLLLSMTRDEALDFLSLTLADLGITGEEIGQWQNYPGICHDCNETYEKNVAAWNKRAKQFPQTPFDFADSYWKKDGPGGRKFKKH